MLRTLFILSIFTPGCHAALRSRYWAVLIRLWPLRTPALVAGRFRDLTHPFSLGMIRFFTLTLGSEFTAVRPDLGGLETFAASRRLRA
jgi:hypothetical protein